MSTIITTYIENPHAPYKQIRVTYRDYEQVSSIPSTARKGRPISLHLKLARNICNLFDLTGNLIHGTTPDGYVFIIVPKDNLAPMHPIIPEIDTTPLDLNSSDDLTDLSTSDDLINQTLIQINTPIHESE